MGNPDRTQRGREAWAAAAVLAAAAALLFAGALLHPSLVVSSPRSDYTGFLLPRASFVAGRILSGGLPLWRPPESCGVPTLGNPQIGVFYPPNLLVLLAGPLRSLAPRFALCFFVAGFSAWAFARQIGVGRAGSLLSGCAFMLSGFFASNIYAGHLQHLSAAAWFPAVLFFADRIAARPRLSDAAGLAVCLALQFDAGHPEYSAYGALAAAAYLAWAWLRSPRAAPLLLLPLALCLFACLAAVQLLPTAEFSGCMTRGREDYAFASGGSLSPLVLPTFLMPDLLGRLAANAYRGPGFYWEQCGYLGAVVLLLAASGARGGGRGRILLALAVFSLLFALGAWTPLHRLICAVLPPLARFRVPSRMLYVYAFSLSVLAGMGLDRVAARGPGRRLIAASLAAVLFLAAAAALLRFLPGPAVAIGRLIVRWRFGIDEGGPHTMPLDRWLSLVPGVRALLAAGAGFRPAAAAGAFLLLLFLRRAGAARGAAFALGASAIACAELLAFAAPLVQLADPRGLHPRTGAIAVMERDRSAFRFLDLSGSMGLERVEPYGIESAFNFESGFLRWYVDALSLVRFRISPLAPGRGLERLCGDFSPHLSPGGPPDTPLRLVNRTTRYRVDDFAAAQNGLDLMNVKYIALNNPVAHPAFEPAWSDGEIFLYRNRSVLPRAFVVHAAESVPDGRGAADRLASFDPRTSCLVAEGPAPACAPGAFSGAEILSRAPDRVVCRADAGGGGVLVLCDIWYPGWEARDNGERRRVFRANGAFRGVAVGPGTRIVEFRYSPLSFRAGRVLSVLGALAALAAVLAGGRGRA